jgi:hypothetical protein
MALKDVGLGVVNLIHLAQDRDHRRTFVNTTTNLRTPYTSRNILEQMCGYQLLKKESAP